MRAMTSSRANYLLSYAMDFACPLVMAYLGVKYATEWTIPLACLGAGALGFTLIEYVTHRWFFHAPRRFTATIHRAHHERPGEPTALPCFSSAVAALMGSWMLSPVLGEVGTYFSLCGLLAAYFYYAVLHHLQHRIRGSAVRARWLHDRWMAHAVHHGRPNMNFGVTTSLWDRVFRTHYLPRRRCRLSSAVEASRVSAASAP
jgi:4-hydroxysphinganine ceramide fatty acyl 2-hydroxylase